jgi:hypothetical protein
MDTQFLSKPTACRAPPGGFSVRVELMAAERLEAEGGGGGHAVTGSRIQIRIRIRIH